MPMSAMWGHVHIAKVTPKKGFEWVTATVRARELFRRGETLEMFQIANIFADTAHIRMGYTPKETLAKWEKDILNGAQGVDPSFFTTSFRRGTLEAHPGSVPAVSVVEKSPFHQQ
jgi:hypothetical protein